MFSFKSNASSTPRARWNVSSDLFCFNLFQMQPEKGPREDVSKGDDWNEGEVIGPSLSVPFNKRYSDVFTSRGSSG